MFNITYEEEQSNDFTKSNGVFFSLRPYSHMRLGHQAMDVMWSFVYLVYYFPRRFLPGRRGSYVFK
jgi:hypothetical protein